MILPPLPPTPLLQWALRGAFWLVVLLMPGGLLLTLVPWLRHHLHKHKEDEPAPCEGC